MERVPVDPEVPRFRLHAAFADGFPAVDWSAAVCTDCRTAAEQLARKAGGSQQAERV